LNAEQLEILRQLVIAQPDATLARIAGTTLRENRCKYSLNFYLLHLV